RSTHPAAQRERARHPVPAWERLRVPDHTEVVDGDDERRAWRDRRAEGGAVENVELRRGVSEPERVPERIAPDGGEAPLAPRLEPDELEAGPAGQLREEAPHVARCPGARLDERGRVDPDPHTAALRTSSFGSG